MKKLTIYCNKCNATQEYMGQANCTECHQRLNNWSVASQLKVQEHLRRQNNDEEDDGS